MRGEFFCDEIGWAKVGPRVEARAKELWKAAGAGSEPLEAYRLDAFLELLGGSGPLEPGGAGWTRVARLRPSKGTRAQAIVVIDAAALRRGTTAGDELCEIEGIGPVSVEAATELLSEASLRYVIAEGFDIKTVTKPTRDVAACIEAALIVRDRTCGRPGCGKRLGLQTDHREVDFGDEGPTELDNLVRLCPRVPRPQDLRRLAPGGRAWGLEMDRPGPPQERALHHPGPPTGRSQRPGQGGPTTELPPAGLSRSSNVAVGQLLRHFGRRLSCRGDDTIEHRIVVGQTREHDLIGAGRQGHPRRSMAWKKRGYTPFAAKACALT